MKRLPFSMVICSKANKCKHISCIHITPHHHKEDCELECISNASKCITQDNLRNPSVLRLPQCSPAKRVREQLTDITPEIVIMKTYYTDNNGKSIIVTPAEYRKDPRWIN